MFIKVRNNPQYFNRLSAPQWMMLRIAWMIL